MWKATRAKIDKAKSIAEVCWSNDQKLDQQVASAWCSTLVSSILTTIYCIKIVLLRFYVFCCRNWLHLLQKNTCSLLDNQKHAACSSTLLPLLGGINFVHYDAVLWVNLFFRLTSPSPWNRGWKVSWKRKGVEENSQHRKKLIVLGVFCFDHGLAKNEDLVLFLSGFCMFRILKYIKINCSW